MGTAERAGWGSRWKMTWQEEPGSCAGRMAPVEDLLELAKGLKDHLLASPPQRTANGARDESVAAKKGKRKKRPAASSGGESTVHEEVRCSLKTGRTLCRIEPLARDALECLGDQSANSELENRENWDSLRLINPSQLSAIRWLGDERRTAAACSMRRPKSRGPAS